MGTGIESYIKKRKTQQQQNKQKGIREPKTISM